jgi:hypothetical protein
MTTLGILLIFIAGVIVGGCLLACVDTLLTSREEIAEICAPEQPEPYEPTTCKHPWRTER